MILLFDADLKPVAGAHRSLTMSRICLGLHRRFWSTVSLVPPLGDTTSQHQQCSLDECVEHNIDESVYRTKHTLDGCHCEMIRPPLSDVNDALRDWTIP